MIVHPFFLVSDGHEADKWKWIAFYLFCYCSPILKVAVNTRERRFIFFNALFKIWALKGYHHTNLFIYISSFAVCLETVGSEESSFYLLPEGIPQATPHQSKITLTLFTINFKISLMMSVNDEKFRTTHHRLLQTPLQILFMSPQVKPITPILSRNIRNEKANIVRWKGNAPLHSSWGHEAHGWWTFHSFSIFKIFWIILRCKKTYGIKKYRSPQNDKI